LELKTIYLKNVVIRSISGLLFAFIVVAGFVAGSLAVGVIFFLFSALGLVEFYRMMGKQPGLNPRYTAGYLVGMSTYVMIYLAADGRMDIRWFWLLPCLVVLMLFMELIYREKNVIINISITVAGWFYVVLPFALLHVISHVGETYSYVLPIGIFCLLWINDSGAYFVGRWIGKHKLYEKVSPNKTIEGLFGGILFSVIATFGLVEVFPGTDHSQWLILSLLIAVLANSGDLFESLLKRTSGVKDSGNILPGHGGVLDRFDGLFFVLPFIVAYLKLFI